MTQRIVYTEDGEVRVVIPAPKALEIKTIEDIAAKSVPAIRPVIPDSFGLENANWQHGQGETCFERTIDPELYPPKEK